MQADGEWTWHVEHHDVVTSTQELAHAWLDLPVAALRVGVFVAEHQTAGAGRQGRAWRDQPGQGLLLSIGVPGAVLPRALQVEGLATRIAQATAAATTRCTGVSVAACKPNDLYVDSRKLGGILVDVRTMGNVVERLVIGIGINVLGDDFEIDRRAATTLAAAGSDVVDRGALRSAISLAALRALRGGHGTMR